jgi:rhamnosyltransferase
MTGTRGHHVAAVIVTRDPDTARLTGAVHAATASVPEITIIDNATGDRSAIAKLASFTPGLRIRWNDSNEGLGAAYNTAIGEAVDRDVTYLLLLDQDTVCPPGYVQRLVEFLDAPANADVAAVGGEVLDHRAGRERRRRRLRQSSGTLFRVSAFPVVGLFDAPLHAYHVDQEWFLRAKSSGFRTAVVPGLTLDHQPGSRLIRVPGVRRSLRIYPDDRLWLMTRNTVALCRRSYVTLPWKTEASLRVLVRVAARLLTCSGRIALVRSQLAAVHEGRLPVFREPRPGGAC